MWKSFAHVAAALNTTAPPPASPPRMYTSPEEKHLFTLAPMRTALMRVPPVYVLLPCSSSRLSESCSGSETYDTPPDPTILQEIELGFSAPLQLLQPTTPSLVPKSSVPFMPLSLPQTLSSTIAGSTPLPTLRTALSYSVIRAKLPNLTAATDASSLAASESEAPAGKEATVSAPPERSVAGVYTVSCGTNPPSAV